LLHYWLYLCYYTQTTACKILNMSHFSLGSKSITQNSITKELQSLIAVCESIWRVWCMCQRLQQIASVSELITNTTFKHLVAIQQPTQLSLWVADIPQQGRPGCLQCSISHLKILSTYCSLCSRTFVGYLFLWFICVSYRRFMVKGCKFNLSTYVPELLVIGRRGCTGRDLNEETLAADNGW
jgi:hypothetical protein